MVGAETAVGGVWRKGGRKRICLPCKGCFCPPESSTSGVEEGTWRVLMGLMEDEVGDLEILNRDTCSDGNRMASQAILGKLGVGLWD